LTPDIIDESDGMEVADFIFLRHHPAMSQSSIQGEKIKH
jgi:hypothetical protein